MYLLIHLSLRRVESIKMKYEIKQIVKYLNKFKLNNIDKLQDVMKAGTLHVSLMAGVTRTPKHEKLLKKAH